MKLAVILSAIAIVSAMPHQHDTRNGTVELGKRNPFSKKMAVEVINRTDRWFKIKMQPFYGTFFVGGSAYDTAMIYEEYLAAGKSRVARFEGGMKLNGGITLELQPEQDAKGESISPVFRGEMENPMFGHNKYKYSLDHFDKHTVSRGGSGGGDDSYISWAIGNA